MLLEPTSTFSPSTVYSTRRLSEYHDQEQFGILGDTSREVRHLTNHVPDIEAWKLFEKEGGGREIYCAKCPVATCTTNSLGPAFPFNHVDRHFHCFKY